MLVKHPSTFHLLRAEEYSISLPLQNGGHVLMMLFDGTRAPFPLLVTGRQSIATFRGRSRIIESPAHCQISAYMVEGSSSKMLGNFGDLGH